MPAIKITFDVELKVDRYIRYGENEDPYQIYENLTEECSDEEREEFFREIVEGDFNSIPGTYDVEASIPYINGVKFNVVAVPQDAKLPWWNEFMSLEQIRRVETEHMRTQLYEALESACYSNEYDSVIELATQLKKLTSNE